MFRAFVTGPRPVYYDSLICFQIGVCYLVDFFTVLVFAIIVLVFQWASFDVRLSVRIKLYVKFVLGEITKIIICSLSSSYSSVRTLTYYPERDKRIFECNSRGLRWGRPMAQAVAKLVIGSESLLKLVSSMEESHRGNRFLTLQSMSGVPAGQDQ